MYANEMIARLAGLQSSLTLSPNYHVNIGQGSNDVVSSCIRTLDKLQWQYAKANQVRAVNTLQALYDNGSTTQAGVSLWWLSRDWILCRIHV